MTVMRPRDDRDAPESFVPASRAPLLAFLAGVLVLVLLAGWLSRLM